jgi:hypothetical protein
MKIVSKILSAAILLTCAAMYSACDGGGGDGKSETEQQFDKLKALTWEFSSATLDGDDRSVDFPNLTLSVDGTFVPETGVYTYTLGGTTPDRSPWPRSGNWIFGTNPLSEIIRDPDTQDVIDMEYVVTETSLVLTFTIPPTSDGWNGGSRGKAVSGEWVFTFDTGN